jgi:hypothetical protein
MEALGYRPYRAKLDNKYDLHSSRKMPGWPKSVEGFVIRWVWEDSCGVGFSSSNCNSGNISH